MVRAVKVVPLADDGGPGGGATAFAAARSFGGAGSAGGSSKRGCVMGKVPSLVFDLEDLGEAAQHAQAEPHDDASLAEVLQKLQSLLEPWSEPEYMLLLHVRFAREDAAKRGQLLAVPDLADTLRRLGYAVKIRTALGGGSGGACLRTLRHSFLSVSVASPQGSITYVLDPRFRDQFEIAHSTARYSKLLESVGPEVVSTQDRLNKVVEVLCSEMARTFTETGHPLPPWRQYSAMLSKWQPRRSEEVDVTAAMNNGAGLLLPPGAPGVGGGGGGVKRLTGPSTVAQRLMMLGVAQQQSAPSPISEGVECGEHCCSDGWESGGVGVSVGTSESSLHLDWEGASGGSDSDGGSGSPVAPMTADPVAVPQRTASTSMSVAAAAAGATVDMRRNVLPPPLPRPPAQDQGRAILEGIRRATAGLPHRRNNTWAG